MSFSFGSPAPGLPKILSSENNRQSYQTLVNTFVTKITWQLTMNQEDMFRAWYYKNYEEQLQKNSDFDLRNTPYDVDGYMIVGTLDLNAEPTQAGAGAGLTKGYLYSCVYRGQTMTGFTCGYTIGTVTEMLANTNIGTVETTAW